MILPYYTLEQASSVLNNKLKSDIYNPKSILVLALNYQIDLHVHFYGDWKLDFDCHIPLDLTNIKNKSIYSAMIYELEIFLRKSSLWSSFFLRLSVNAIDYLIVNKKGLAVNEATWFDAVLCLKDALKPEIEQNSLQNYLLREIEHPPFSSLDESEIRGVSFLAIYPTTSKYEETKPKPIKYDDEEDIFYPFLKLNNVFITHAQLEKIINSSLVERNVLKNNERKAHLITSAQRGVSKEKQNAKLAAQTLADFLWRNDKDKRIRIKEMAINVRAELFNTNHSSQLPEKAESLEDWIREIAEKYPHSRKGGRPSNRE